MDWHEHIFSGDDLIIFGSKTEFEYFSLEKKILRITACCLSIVLSSGRVHGGNRRHCVRYNGSHRGWYCGRGNAATSHTGDRANRIGAIYTIAILIHCCTIVVIVVDGSITATVVIIIVVGVDICTIIYIISWGVHTVQQWISGHCGRDHAYRRTTANQAIILCCSIDFGCLFRNTAQHFQ